MKTASKIYYVMLAIVMGMSGELFAMDDMPNILMPTLTEKDFCTQDGSPVPLPRELSPYEKYLDGLSFEKLVAEEEKVDNKEKVAKENYQAALTRFREKERLWKEAGSVLPKPEPGHHSLLEEYPIIQEAMKRKRAVDRVLRKKVPDDDSGKFIKGD